MLSSSLPERLEDSLALWGLVSFILPVHIVFDVLRYWPVWHIFVVTIFNYVSDHPAISTYVEEFCSLDKYARIFIILFLFRYTRLVVNTISFLTSRPTPIPNFPRIPIFKPEDVTVIVPTVEPSGKDFRNCIASIINNNPAGIKIVTAGPGKDAQVQRTIKAWDNNIISTALHCKVPNKRAQICKALQKVETPITVLCDDHVIWPKQLLPNLLSPFNDHRVGAVGTCKRVIRISPQFSWADFWNFLGTLYLERHNFETAATNSIDGGLFCLSGRTSAHRTHILQDPSFIYKFLNEYTFWGLFGPLHADDDNFITRWMVNHDWKIKIQCSDDARILTTLGTYPRFLSQCLRWSRSSWRSNAASLFKDGTVWRNQPWSVYAIYLSSFVNFALFYDAALFYTLWLARAHPVVQNVGPESAFKYLGLWIFCSKLVKPFPHFWRNPGDLIYLPGYILFGYYHSLIKLYALLTIGVTTWGTRPNVDGKSEDPTAESHHSADNGILAELSEWDFITEFSRWDIFSKAYVLFAIYVFGFKAIVTSRLEWPTILVFISELVMLVCLNKPCHDEERFRGASDSYWRWKYWWKSFLGIYKWDTFSTTFMAAGIHRMISEAIVGWLGLPPGMELASYLQGLAGVFWWVCLSRRHRFLGELFRLRNIYLLWVHWWQLWVYWWKTLRFLRGKESEIGKNGVWKFRFKRGMSKW